VTTPRSIGHGIGLRTTHFPYLLENKTNGIDWFEIISENFFEPGGRPWAILEKVRREVPVVAHGVSLGIGSVDPLSESYLSRLDWLVKRIEPVLVSDHLCWGSYKGQYAHDLLPLPYTEEALQHVAERVEHVQDKLGRSILLENVSSYVTFAESSLTEWDFLNEIARRTGCEILLDVNNIFVSARNHGFSATEYIDAITKEKVRQFHLAGHTDHGSYLLDSHIGPIPSGVWDLYRYAVKRFGEVSTLIEWDENVPDFETVVAESTRAKEIEAEVLRGL
jgi:uncharacterized protein (UPF0276 family)